MIRNTDALKMLRNSAFVHNHSSSPSWPALAQGFRRAKKPGRWPRGSTDEARSSPGSDSGNATGPGTHWHARFWPDSGNTAIESMKAVFIDAIVNFKFRLPPHPLSFSALSFLTLQLIFSKVIFVCLSSC